MNKILNKLVHGSTAKGKEDTLLDIQKKVQ